MGFVICKSHGVLSSTVCLLFVKQKSDISSPQPVGDREPSSSQWPAAQRPHWSGSHPGLTPGQSKVNSFISTVYCLLLKVCSLPSTFYGLRAVHFSGTRKAFQMHIATEWSIGWSSDPWFNCVAVDLLTNCTKILTISKQIVQGSPSSGAKAFRSESLAIFSSEAEPRATRARMVTAWMEINNGKSYNLTKIGSFELFCVSQPPTLPPPTVGQLYSVTSPC